MDTNTNTNKRGRGRPAKTDKPTAAQRQQQYRERQHAYMPATSNKLMAAAVAEHVADAEMPILLALISIAQSVVVPGKTRSVGIERARALLAQYPADSSN